MKYLKPILILLTTLGLIVLYILQSTGFFKSIENRFDGDLLKKIEIPGAEDMQIDDDRNFLIISSDDRAALRDGHTRQGHLYKIDLQDSSLVPIRLTEGFERPFYPHGISMIKLSDSLHRLFVVNHFSGTHAIEIFDLFGDSLVHRESKRDPLMIAPNDVVALGENQFYFTNDHGYQRGFKRVLEEYVGLRASNVIYYDGISYREVADGIAYANGINFDVSRNLLFVASPRDFLVKVYKVNVSGDLEFIENIDCGTGVDNIALDSDGKLWIGAHPSLLHYSMYAGAKKEYSGSEIITIEYLNEGDYSVQSIYMSDGLDMSASTVAVPYNELIFVGNVMDKVFLVLKGKK